MYNEPKVMFTMKTLKNLVPDELSKEDFLVAVETVDNEIQKPANLITTQTLQTS